MNTEQGNAIATEYEYPDRAASNFFIVHSYSVAYQSYVSLATAPLTVEEVVVMVTANEKYSQLKSTYKITLCPHTNTTRECHSNGI